MSLLEDILINGKIFSYVKTRTYAPVSVYRGENEFLRIGPKEVIVKELNLHKKLLKFDFPIPQILSEGERNGQYYYIETSLGDIIFGDIFREDTNKNGSITDENFQKLLILIERFTRAQLKTAENNKIFENFYFGIHVDYLIEELPHLQNKIVAGFEKLKTRISPLPLVITHGDFNPHNFLENGVIDFENIFSAPAGYDIVSNVYHSFLFPKEGDFEIIRRYEFLDDQINDYFSLINFVYTENNLPKLSDFAEDFMFGRMIWSAVRMQRCPKIQAWRYKKFEEILENYLSDGANVISIIKN